MNKRNIIFQCVIIPLRMSPSVVGGDFNPGFVTVTVSAFTKLMFSNSGFIPKILPFYLLGSLEALILWAPSIRSK